MSKSVYRRASQSRPLLGKSVERTQSPCSRQRMRILVSARLQATAAPEAPEPMISTSTLSLSAMSGLPRLAPLGAIVAPEGRPLLDDLEQRPVALLHLVAFGERRTRLVSDRLEHAVVPVIGAEDRPAQRHRRLSAPFGPVHYQPPPAGRGRAGRTPR